MSKSSRPSRKKPPEQGLVNVVAAQSIKGQNLTFDKAGGLQLAEAPLPSGTTGIKAFREIDGRPVSHASTNRPPFRAPGFEARKLHRWGLLNHPRVVLASEDIDGEMRFYVDTRVPGFYLLWTALRIDSSYAFTGLSGTSHDLVAWMPRVKGDTVSDAGFRLVHAAMLKDLFVREGEWHCDPCLAEGMYATRRVAMIIGSIAPTIHKSDEDLRWCWAEMPEYLRPLYEARATVGTVNRRYRH